KSVGSPFDLVHRAGPRLSCKYRPIPFGKFAVEGCIMGDDNCCIGSKSRYGIAINFMAGGHFVGNAVELDRLFRDRSAGFVERTKAVENGLDRAGRMRGKLNNA